MYRVGRVDGTREMVVRPNYIVVYAESPEDGDYSAHSSCCAAVAMIGVQAPR